MLETLFELVGLLVSNGALLVVIILGLTQVVKLFGATGKVALAANIVIGLVMGTLIVVGQYGGFPQYAQLWVAMILFDLLCSLIAAGIYKVVADPKATA